MKAKQNEVRLMPECSITPQEISFLWLEITAKCNLECRHCYADSGPREQLLGEMSTQEWLQVLDDCSTLGCRQTQFIGGEPTLHPDLPEMIAFACERGYSFIEVFTNATRITESLMQVLVKHKAHIAVSFYSDDPATHDTITKRQGSFDRTVRNIERLINAGVPVRAGIIETHLNVGHSPAARSFLESLGVSDIKVDGERGIGRGARNEHVGDPMTELCGECWKGKLCVTSSSRTYPCVFSRFVDIGSAKKGISTLLESDSLHQFRTVLKNYKHQISCDPTHSSCQPETFRACQPTGCVPLSKCAPDCAPSCGPSSSCRPNVSDR
jgi:hypothetical protein